MFINRVTDSVADGVLDLLDLGVTNEPDAADGLLATVHEDNDQLH
jgi:hypothetical protein